MKFQDLLDFQTVSKETNQVARFIAETLAKVENIPNGFIDEKEIEYGVEFQAKIDSAIKKSLTFVQVISKESFTLAGRNWCQYEYDEYKSFLSNVLVKKNINYADAFNSNILFLVMGQTLGDVQPAILISEYDNWFMDIGHKNYIKFYTPHQDFNTFMDNIKSLGQAIINAKHNLINAL